MSVLYIGLLVFAYVGASSGDETCKGSSEIPVFGTLGGHVLLQLEESERGLCPWKCQLQVKKNSRTPVTKTEIPTNKTSAQCTNMKPNCQVFNNGSLQLSHLTPEVSGTYSLTLESNGACKYEKYFRVHIQDPVSVPQVNYTCQRNSSVHLSCLAENGTDPSYSWHVDGTPRWTLTKEILTGYKSVLRHVTCTVKNNVSEEWSQPTNITCPDPVSEPEVQYNCFAGGVIGLCCHVENGTDVSYDWSLNGTCYNNSKRCMNTTVEQIELSNVTCNAWNLAGVRKSRPVTVSCLETSIPHSTPTPTPTPTTLSTDFSSTWSPAINSTGNSTSSSKGCVTWKGFTCVQWSAIGAAGILSVTVLPLIISVLCTMPRKADL